MSELSASWAVFKKGILYVPVSNKGDSLLRYYIRKIGEISLTAYRDLDQNETPTINDPVRPPKAPKASWKPKATCLCGYGTSPDQHMEGCLSAHSAHFGEVGSSPGERRRGSGIRSEDDETEKASNFSLLVPASAIRRATTYTRPVIVSPMSPGLARAPMVKMRPKIPSRKGPATCSARRLRLSLM